jgi:site-specific recombinase XerD
MNAITLGQVIHSFFIDHLQIAKGLRPSSVSAYRDGMRLFLRFVAEDAGCKLTKLPLDALTPERVLGFLRSLETDRGNQVRTRNQRLAILRTFFQYLGGRVPELLVVAERVAHIPTKRAPPPETHFLDREDIRSLFESLPSGTWATERDRSLMLFLYNTGARVQEAADLRVGHLELNRGPRVRLHGKGDKWRTCPLWAETAKRLQQLVRASNSLRPEDPVFRSQRGAALTRFGIYKIVRRHGRPFDSDAAQRGRRVTPHVFRHTTAVHLLEAGVEVNVIRGWLGHVSLETTHRYAEINVRTKAAALEKCVPPSLCGGPPRTPPWRTDASLMAWLDSL